MVESNTDNKLRGSHMLSKSTNSNTNELALSYISNQENKFKVLSPVRPKARTIIKLEDLLILEERLNILLTGIFNLDENIIGGVSGQCYEWLTFYYNSSLVDSLQYYGENQTEQILLKTENNLEIFAIIIAYELSYFHTLVKAFKGILKNAFMKIKRNYLLIVKILFFNIEYTEEEEMFYLKFVNIMKRNGIEQEVPIDNIYFEMKRNCSEIVLHLKSIISEYKNNKIPITNDLIYAFNNLSRFNNVMLDKLLHERIIPYLKGGDQEILNQANFNQSNSAYLDVNNNNNITNNIKGIKNPYIKTPSRKKYTLILDLDETLICCKYKLNALDQKLLSLRPWLIKFLKSVREYYEIISFTCGKKDYAMPILDLIENGEKLFDHKLYREHSSILDHDYIKDISLIGRELNKMIIVDNNLMSFRKQKENGILICPFYAQDSNDKVLLELESILIRMAKENEEDIRKTLLKYKEEIILKVSRSA
ncbi:MAG: HAD family hydrolase [archaeon]|nr:HAD family hydrolase [archaeon]